MEKHFSFNSNEKPGLRTGGWSTSGPLTPRGNLNVGLQCSFYDELDIRQRPAGLYTVQFGVSAPAGLYKKVNPVATVVWGCEGNTIQRRLSVCDGASISGTADHVAVRVADQSDDVGTPRLGYQVTITVTPYTRPSPDRPFLRAGGALIVVAGGANSTLAVPDDAGVTSALVMAVAAGGGLPRVSQESIDPAVVYGQYVPDGRYTPLFPQTSVLRLENVNAAVPASTVTYNVLWGIDG